MCSSVFSFIRTSAYQRTVTYIFIMISSFHLFLVVASCLLFTHAHIDNNRYAPWDDLSTYKMQDYDLNDDQIIVSQRAANFIFPPTSLVALTNRANDYRDFFPNKRQTFGRKNHWDAFFGRRR
ncbi:hypothetical protein I4U23_020903 [Adineta vaga]|nr:hypothetical protein I4U23_020903 [Adineta vaga]